MKAQTEQLIAIMKAFGEAKEGNVVTLDFVDGATASASTARRGERFRATLSIAALTKIWLGDKPAQPDLKQAMLGG